MKLSTILISSSLYSLSSADCNNCGPFNDGACDNQPFAIKHNDLYWAWAAPCSANDGAFGCGVLEPIPYGWRRATNDEFNAGYPDIVTICGINPSLVWYFGECCAADVFDGYTDPSGVNTGGCNPENFARPGVTNLDQGPIWYETVLVHDDCANPCISSCEGLEDGHYQSCQGCSVYASCVAGNIYDSRPCAPADPPLLWDDISKTCEVESDTCVVEERVIVPTPFNGELSRSLSPGPGDDPACVVTNTCSP